MLEAQLSWDCQGYEEAQASYMEKAPGDTGGESVIERDGQGEGERCPPTPNCPCHPSPVTKSMSKEAFVWLQPQSWFAYNFTKYGEQGLPSWAH